MKKTKSIAHRTLSRRSVLSSGALAATASIAGSVIGSKNVSAATAKGAPAKNMHISCAAYSMRDIIEKGEMDVFGFIDMCADMECAGTELTSYYFKENFDGKYLRELRRRAFNQGVTVSGTAIRNNFCRPDGPAKQNDIDHVRRWIDYAAELYAPHIRIFAGNMPKDAKKEDGIKWVADGVRKCLDHAAEVGVFLGLENHGGITARAADHLAICDAVGEHPWFGINLDTGNYRTNPYQELAMSAPRAVNVQIKVEVFTGPNGTKELADLERFRDILVNAGYKGWVVLEYEAAGDPREEIPMYIRRLKEMYEGV